MRATVHIQNLKCDGCKNTIVKRLSDKRTLVKLKFVLKPVQWHLIIIQIMILKPQNICCSE